MLKHTLLGLRSQWFFRRGSAQPDSNRRVPVFLPPLSRSPLSIVLGLLVFLLALGLPACGGSGDDDDDDDSSSPDADADGYTVADGDCDDTRADIYPGADEVCDSYDNDCDGNSDIQYDYYPDVDGDGYGDPDGKTKDCSAPNGYVEDDNDCDDNDPSRHPGADEICDGIDNDCDDVIDDGVTTTYYEDTDGDGFGNGATAIQACEAPSSTYITQAGDCDDSTDETYPGALELCDGLDNNCDGAADDKSDQFYFRDRDADGFGDENDYLLTCGAPTGYVDAMGDCDDTDSTIYPGAADLSGDGIDSDCGGGDTAQPSVGLNASTFTLIQDALDAAEDGDTIFVGPGTYREKELNFNGLTLRLIGTHGAYSTVVNANGAGRVMTFEGREDGALVKRLTLRAGLATNGGGLYLDQSSPTLEDLIIAANTADLGGGIYITNASPRLLRVTVTGNSATQEGKGGGIYVIDGSPTIDSSTIRDNTLTNGEGAGIWMSTSSMSIVRSTIEGNQNLGYDPTKPTLGGGLYMTASNPVIQATLIHGNTSNGPGGGAYVVGSTPSFEHCTIVANRGDSHGGGIYVTTDDASTTSIEIQGSILAYNTGENFYNEGLEETAISMTETLLFHRDAALNHNLDSLSETITIAEPEFVAFRNNGIDDDDDYHLLPTSPAVDALEGEDDEDGSPADLGAFGGPDADRSYYEDQDGDGLYDGWEKRVDLDVEVADASADYDADGLTNAEEFDYHANPWEEDTDGDQSRDGDEVLAGSDPADWYSQPDDSSATAYVGVDFSSIQAAVDAIQTQGTIVVPQGSYESTIVIANKDIALLGEGDAADVVLIGSESTVMSVIYSDVTIQGFTLTEGVSPDLGGGMHVRGTTGTISDMILTGNIAVTGAGFHIAYSDDYLTLENIESGANLATDSGGGLAMSYSSPTLINLYVHDNGAGDVSSDAEGDGPGAGMLIESSSPHLYNVSFHANSTMARGGSALTITNGTFEECHVAVDLIGAGATLEHVTAINNEIGLRTDSGAGTTVTILNSIFAYSSTANLSIGSGVPTDIGYSDFYQPSSCTRSCSNHNGVILNDTNTEDEPSFESYNAVGDPTDFHLSLQSSLQDAGDPEGDVDDNGVFDIDLDGSVPDMGAYGGPFAAGFDRDGDGYADYFWSGDINAAPAGFSPDDYDCADRDPSTRACTDD